MKSGADADTVAVKPCGKLFAWKSFRGDQKYRSGSMIVDRESANTRKFLDGCSEKVIIVLAYAVHTDAAYKINSGRERGYSRYSESSCLEAFGEKARHKKLFGSYTVTTFSKC